MKDIICAIDTTNYKECLSILSEIEHHVFAVKFGLEFFMAFGMEGIKKILKVHPKVRIFLDMKFHDIPNTVAGAIKSLINLEHIIITTVHAAGGGEMIKRAVEMARTSKLSLLSIIAVTKLTSLDTDLNETLRLAELAMSNGADGIVCSPQLCAEVRKQLGPKYGNFTIITPGIRMPEEIVKLDDQRSTCTPKQAMDNGSSFLVIGRPITQSANKVEMIRRIQNSIKENTTKETSIRKDKTRENTTEENIIRENIIRTNIITE